MILPRATACCWLAWHTGYDHGLKVIDRKRALCVYARQAQQQRRTLLHDPYPCMVTAMDPALIDL